jgi:Putative glucoamylase
VRNTRPAHRERADQLLKPMDFGFFYAAYDPADPVRNPGLLRGVYWPDDKSFGTLYGLVNTEPRIASYIGIARGQLPPEHYYRINRTWRPGGVPRAQSQSPHGESRTYLGIDVFEGHYTYRGMRIVPSWGGSMFEALMVSLFVPEARWAPRSWGVNHPLYVRAQIEHGLDEARYGFWGFSPSCRPGGGYRTYGVDAIGVDPQGYTSDDGNVPAGTGKGPGALAGGVVTPHASFLALRFAPREAMANLRALADKFSIYGPYGFHDSVNVSSGKVSKCVLALDQGMIMAAIANALADDAMRTAFIDQKSERILRPLIAPEEFTAGQASLVPPTRIDARASQDNPPGVVIRKPSSEPED